MAKTPRYMPLNTAFLLAIRGFPAYIPSMNLRRVFWLCSYLCALLCMALPAHADYENDPFDPIIARDAWMLIAQAERDNSIPAGLLHAMSLVETGKGIRGWVLPWPYTVGVNGTGVQRFTTREEALAAFTRYRSFGFVNFNLTAPGVRLSKAKPVAVASALGSLPSASVITLEGINFGRRFNSETEAATFLRRMFSMGYRNVDVGMMQVNWRVHSQNFKNIEEALNPNTNLNYAVRYLMEHRQTRDWWGSVGRYHSGTSRYANRYIRSVYTMYLRIHRVNT